jgi:diguanylate cyclase (GGDEF)-like protein
MQPRQPASLNQQFLLLLAAVVVFFLVGLGVSLHFARANFTAAARALAEREVSQAQAALIRRVDYYRAMLARIAADPEVIALLETGMQQAQEEWALSRKEMLPDTLGLALVGKDGRVLGDADVLRVGPVCLADLLASGEAPGQAVGPVHREAGGLEHFDLQHAIKDDHGRPLGRVFVSVRLQALDRVLRDVTYPEHALRLLDRQGRLIAAHGGKMRDGVQITRAIPDLGWVLVADTPQAGLYRSQWMMIGAAGVTLLAVLLLLSASMAGLRRGMLDDLRGVQWALEDLAEGKPLPAIHPHYREVAGTTRAISTLAGTLHEQHAQLTRLSLTDPLTGMANRRAFEMHFEKCMAMASRQHPVALILIDVDHFKQINDRHGHAAGDLALKALAQTFGELTRTSDFAARIAGDEFVVLLNHVRADGLENWYQRLQDHFRSELRALGLDISSGLSAGQTWLASVPDDDLGLALARADHALYHAKARGRGQMACDGDAESLG